MTINQVSVKVPCTPECFSINQNPVSSVLTTIKAKIECVWNKFLILINRASVDLQIQNEIDKVNKAENISKSNYITALESAFVRSLAAVKSHHIETTHLPKQVALQFTDILTRYGIAIYGNKDAPHPHQSALDVLNTALLMQEYALGLSQTAPDLSKVTTIQDLYANQQLRDSIEIEAHVLFDHLDPECWVKKMLMLTEKQHVLLSKIILYVVAAYDHLGVQNLELSEKLLMLGEQSLIAAGQIPSFNQIEVNDALAELKYNCVTGFLAKKRELLTERLKEADADLAGELEHAKELTSQALENVWEDCVKFSKDPAKMQARCDNKRVFIEKMTPQQEVEWFTKSLNKHLALSKKDPVLFPVIHHNLSHAYEKVGDFTNALKYGLEAMKLAIESAKKGERSVLFDSIFKHSEILLAKAQEIQQQSKITHS
jgi:tetratricopeptide (TPR) repeat protein